MAKFYESQAFARLKNLLMGVGAAIVLIGALFKILHWPYASLMLMVGMFTEAFIFTFLGILPPHKEYHWEKVYPGLDVAPDHVRKKKDMKKQGESITQQLDKMLEDSKIETELLDRLGKNLHRLGDNLEKMNDVADAGKATSEYSQQAREATVALAEMKDAYSNASKAVTDLSEISLGTKEYHEQVQLVSKNLAALNAVYELELQDTNNHLKAMNRFYGSLAKAMDNLNDSVDDTIRYKDEMAQLSNNLSQLNQVYGNMLGAMRVDQQQSV